MQSSCGMPGSACQIIHGSTTAECHTKMFETTIQSLAGLMMVLGDIFEGAASVEIFGVINLHLFLWRHIPDLKL